jgi:hypothetical protein
MPPMAKLIWSFVVGAILGGAFVFLLLHRYEMQVEPNHNVIVLDRLTGNVERDPGMRF